MNLTPTERRILSCIMAGQVHKEIAASLNIGERTVKFHASSIYAKHGVASREELIRLKQSGGSKFEWDKLMETEKRICKLSVDHTQREIAAIVGVSESTVRLRLRVSYGILRVNGRAGLAAYMGKHGILSAEADVIELKKRTA